MKSFMLVIACLFFSVSAFASNCKIDTSVGEVVFKGSKWEVEQFCRTKYTTYNQNNGCFFRQLSSKRWEGNFRTERSFSSYNDYKEWHNGNKNHTVRFSGNCSIYY